MVTLSRNLGRWANNPTHTGIDAQYDVSYSSRPQGGSEKAVQSFAAIIEHTTARKLPIAAAVANKRCTKRSCDHTQERCKKNYSSDQSIASSERSLLHKALDDVKKPRLITLRSVTTDASAQLAKALRDYNSTNNSQIMHYKCFIHRVRTMEKHIRDLQLSSIPKAHDKHAYRQKLASSIRSRIRTELKTVRNLQKNDAAFIKSAAAAIQNITKCLSGDHRQCRLGKSYVCKSHLSTYSTSSLPYGVHLELKDHDLSLIQKEIDKMFDEEGLNGMCKLYDTNMVESLHSGVYFLAPKTSSYSRNFPALCHSAVHSASLGPSRSTLGLIKEAGIKVYRNSPMYVQLKLKERRRKYHSKRKASPEYKQRRYFLRKRKSNRSLFANSLYSLEQAASPTATEHNYGLSS